MSIIATPNITEQAFLSLLNSARANPAAYGSSIGVDLSTIAPAPPLAFDVRLVYAARAHAQDMATRDFVSHTNPDGLDPFARDTAAGFPGKANRWGESIAVGTITATPAQALQQLITDSGNPDLGHRKHLLGVTSVGQNLVGVGYVNVPGTTWLYYWTIDTSALPQPDTRDFSPHNADYVRRLYLDCLGRRADDVEVAGWLESTSRAQIATGIGGSYEAKMRLLKVLFTELLLRQPNIPDGNIWQNSPELIAALKLRTLIVGSDEYFNR